MTLVDNKSEVEVSPQHTKTESGLVLKNVRRVEEIRTKLEVNINAVFFTWQVCRPVRRDFHLVTSKLYIKSLKPELRSQIGALCDEFVLQTEFLKSECAQYVLNYDLGATHVPLRIVNRDAALIYKTFKDVDEIMARLQCAQTDLLISREKANEIVRPVFEAFSSIKSYALQNNTRTAAELGKDIGIS